MISNKITAVKTVVNIIAGAGVSKIVNDIITNNTITGTTADTAKVWVGSVVLGSMVAERVSDHVNAKIDETANHFADRKEQKDNK